jgi:hypothetical protein
LLGGPCVHLIDGCADDGTCDLGNRTLAETSAFLNPCGWRVIVRLESETPRVSPAVREESCLLVDIEYCGVHVRFGRLTGVLFVFVFAVAFGVSLGYWNKGEAPKNGRQAVETVVNKSDRTGQNIKVPSLTAGKQVPAASKEAEITQVPLVLKPQVTRAAGQQGVVCHPNAVRLAGALFPLRSSPEARADNIILNIGPEEMIDVIDSRIVHGAWVYMRHRKGVEGWVGRCFLHCDGVAIAEKCRWGGQPNLFDATIGFFQELFDAET